MKQLFIIRITAAFFVLFQSFITPFSDSSKTKKNTYEIVTLIGGTPVSFKLNQNIDSKDLEKGHTVLFIVDDDVVAENQVVIRKGERAEGLVIDIKRPENKGRFRDKYQQIQIAVTRVKAVDGQYVWLYDKPFLKHSDCAKCSIPLNTMVRLESTVQQNTDIVIR
jgi:hypothetical protein